MLQGSSRGERLARELKTPRLFTEIIQGVFCLGSELPRVVMEHVLPSVVRTEAAKATFGCRPSGDGIFAN